MQTDRNWIWDKTEKMVYRVLKFIFGVCRKELPDSIFQVFMQFVKFGIVGVSNVLVSYMLYIIFLFGFQKAGILIRFDYIVAQIISYALSILWSFYWNNKLVFKAENGRRRTIWKALVKTSISYSFTGFFVNSVLLLVCVQVLGISELVAPLINLVISVPLNFIINKFWAFK